MGLFRGSFLFIVGFLLLVSLLLCGVFLTLTKSLEYDNVKREISPIAHELASGQNTVLGRINVDEFDVNAVSHQAVTVMQKHCKDHTEYTFTFEGKTISIPCSTLQGGTQAVINETLNDVIDQIYYAEYTCGFFKCLTSGQLPLVLVSKQAKDFWYQKFYFTLIAILILSILAFFFVEKKLNWPLLIGILAIIAVIPLLKIKSIIAFLIPEKFESLSLFLNIFFSEAYPVFFIFFIIGLVFIGAGLGLKFSNSEWVKNLSDKLDKKEDKKESKKK
jgi:hypothetical protein